MPKSWDNNTDASFLLLRRELDSNAGCGFGTVHNEKHLRRYTSEQFLIHLFSSEEICNSPGKLCSRITKQRKTIVFVATAVALIIVDPMNTSSEQLSFKYWSETLTASKKSTQHPGIT
jgi:hypothetical protein